MKQNKKRISDAFPYLILNEIEEVNIFDSLEECKMVLDKLLKVARVYNMVTISDFYTFTGHKRDQVIYTKYGWTYLDLCSCDCYESSEETWYIELPEIQRIY